MSDEVNTAEAMRRLRTPGSTAKERLVAASVALLTELTPAQLITAVGTRAIAQRAGVSPGLVFHHFGDTAGLAAAVIERVYDPQTLPVEQVTRLVEHLERAALPIDASMLLHNYEFDRVLNDPELRLRTGLWAFGGTHATDAYARYLNTVDGRIAPFMDRLFAGWHRELRPPWTSANFLATQSALLSGSVIRHLVTPTSASKASFVNAAATLAQISLRPIGDSRDVASQLREVNYYRPSSRIRATRASRDAPRRDRVLHAAQHEFDRTGFQRATLSAIARRASVSMSTMYALFPTKSAIGAELFSCTVSPLIQRDKRSTLFAFLTLAENATIAPHLAGCYIARLIEFGHDASEDELLHVVRTDTDDIDLERARLAIVAVVRAAVGCNEGELGRVVRGALAMSGVVVDDAEQEPSEIQ